jgi:hypothetical protein
VARRRVQPTAHASLGLKHGATGYVRFHSRNSKLYLLDANLREKDEMFLPAAMDLKSGQELGFPKHLVCVDTFDMECEAVGTYFLLFHQDERPHQDLKELQDARVLHRKRAQEWKREQLDESDAPRKSKFARRSPAKPYARPPPPPPPSGSLAHDVSYLDEDGDDADPGWRPGSKPFFRAPSKTLPFKPPSFVKR